MIISLCIPCMNRTRDLRKAMLYFIRVANASPPVEILILDYNSQDDLEEYVRAVKETIQLAEGNTLAYVKYSSEQAYWRTAHARNLAAKSSIGEYIAMWAADMLPSENYIEVVREMLKKDDYVWMRGKRYKGAVICQRKEFMEAGGYDERFEFYGPEDKDLEARLVRREAKFGRLPHMLDVIKTSREEQLRNYRLKITKRQMSQRTKPIYEENIKNYVLVANQGKEWGQP